jgi:hypothetical protein
MQLITLLRSRIFRYTFLLLAAIYLMFSVGVIKVTHFCMGREASVTYFSSEPKNCSCLLDASEKNHCCSDKNEVIKIKDEQKTIQAYTIRVPQLYILEDLYTERLITSLAVEKVMQAPDDVDVSPPPVPLFKSHCSFVFYDGELSA